MYTKGSCAIAGKGDTPLISALIGFGKEFVPCEPWVDDHPIDTFTQRFLSQWDYGMVLASDGDKAPLAEVTRLIREEEQVSHLQSAVADFDKECVL